MAEYVKDSFGEVVTSRVPITPKKEYIQNELMSFEIPEYYRKRNEAFYDAIQSYKPLEISQK